MLPILIPPTPRRCVDFVAARRIDEQDAEREPILLDESGDIVDDLEERRRRWRRRCGLSKVLVVRNPENKSGPARFSFSASFESCERAVRCLFQRQLLSLPKSARDRLQPLLEISRPVTMPAGALSADAVACLLWESNWRGLSTFCQMSGPSLHVQTLTVKWWMSAPESLRFGCGDELLAELRECARNVYRFWQCVALRMQPYNYYFIDPRLITIEFRAANHRRDRQFAND